MEIGLRDTQSVLRGYFMKRQSELNEKTIEMARKEQLKVEKLIEKINKAKIEIEKIKRENRWLSYLGGDFDKNATEEQQIDFYNNFSDIR